MPAYLLALLAYSINADPYVRQQPMRLEVKAVDAHVRSYHMKAVLKYGEIPVPARFVAITATSTRSQRNFPTSLFLHYPTEVPTLCLRQPKALERLRLVTFQSTSGAACAHRKGCQA